MRTPVSLLLLALFSSCASETAVDSDAAIDAQPLVDAEVGSNEVCQLAASNASISGTTPIGPIDHSYAWFGLDEECNTWQIVTGNTSFVVVEGNLGDTEARLDIEVVDADLLGARSATVTYSPSSSNAIYIGYGTVTISAASDDSITATISVQEDGWDLEGSFEIQSNCQELPIPVCI